MSKRKFNIGDKVQVSWVDHSIPNCSVVSTPDETEDDYWHLRTPTGRLFTQNQYASNFEGLWEAEEEEVSSDKLN